MIYFLKIKTGEEVVQLTPFSPNANNERENIATSKFAYK